MQGVEATLPLAHHSVGCMQDRFPCDPDGGSLSCPNRWCIQRMELQPGHVPASGAWTAERVPDVFRHNPSTAVVASVAATGLSIAGGRDVGAAGRDRAPGCGCEWVVWRPRRRAAGWGRRPVTSGEGHAAASPPPPAWQCAGGGSRGGRPPLAGTTLRQAPLSTDEWWLCWQQRPAAAAAAATTAAAIKATGAAGEEEAGRGGRRGGRNGAGEWVERALTTMTRARLPRARNTQRNQTDMAAHRDSSRAVGDRTVSCTVANARPRHHSGPAARR